jgi:RNA polymerase sigma-70 factor (family 1)
LVDNRTDSDLLELWSNGNEQAFEAIYHRYALKLLGIAIDKTRDRDAAEELVQDTFVTLHKSKASVKRLNNIMAFLYVVLKNKILDHHRRNLSRKKFADYFSQFFTEAVDTTNAIVETKELERLLEKEIANLPAQCRAVFTMRRMEFLSNKEIASKLNISENTVEQHMRKALKQLRLSLINHDLLLLGLALEWFSKNR